MAIEVDFIGTPDVKDDYDAIAFRVLNSGYKVNCVFDGGTTVAGEALITHLETYYGANKGVMPELDYVFCSHGDRDHSAGLIPLLEKVKVKNVIINFPWDVLDELYKLRKNTLLSKDGLLRKLKDSYPELAEIERLIQGKGINRIQGFVDDFAVPGFTLLSPFRNYYIQKIAESDKTPAMKVASDVSYKAKGDDGWDIAVKYTDSLKENVATTPENEASIVLYVEGYGYPALFTADAGVEGLGMAVKFAKYLNIDLSKLQLIQVPHHGGRHNVTAELLDDLLGPVGSVADDKFRWAFVSVGNESDHPMKCVTNAFWNRGWNVYVSSSGSLHGVKGAGFPPRNWKSQAPVGFSYKTEKWDE